MKRSCKTIRLFFFYLGLTGLFVLTAGPSSAEPDLLDLGLTERHYQRGKVPAGWHLRKSPGKTKGASAGWHIDNGIAAIKLESKANLTFLEKNVSIDLKNYPIISWKWKVMNILAGVDERTKAGDSPNIYGVVIWRREKLLTIPVNHGRS